ncbi:MAG: VOC family protein [Gammaproteobacteria bacterium]|nr:VOC family protein [Gammaproteobacteria bacterium]
MKRFHVHVSVKDLTQSIGFYSKIFGATPSVEKVDYAKWMLDDPRINFAISQRGHVPGVNHLGFQVDSDEELRGLRNQVASADLAALDEPGAACCYAKSDKYWVEDPQGIAWETFHSLGTITVFGEDGASAKAGEGYSACCIPLAKQPSDHADAACCVPKVAQHGQAACCG